MNVRVKIIGIQIMYDVIAFFLLGQFVKIGVCYFLKVFNLDVTSVSIMGVTFMPSIANDFTIGWMRWCIVSLSVFFSTAIFLGLNRLVKGIFFYLLKSVTLYAIVHPCDTVIDSFKGVMKCYKSTALIPAANKIIRQALELLEDSVSNTNLNGTLHHVLQVLEDKKLFRLGKSLLAAALDYLDECILAYCYKNNDLDMLQNSCKAIKLYMVHAPKMLLTTLSLVSVRFLINLFSFILFIIYIVQTQTYYVFSIIQIYIFYKCILFVFHDAFFEPLFLNKMVSTFIDFDDSDINNIHLSDDIKQHLFDLKNVFITNEREQALNDLNFEQRKWEDE